MTNKPKAKALLLPLSWRDMFDRLSDKEAAALIRAAFAVAAGEGVPSGLPRAAFAFMPQIEGYVRGNQEHYDDVCRKRKEAINERWRREKAKNTKCIQNDTNVSECNTNGIQSGINSNSNSNSNNDINTPLPPVRGKRLVNNDQTIISKWIIRCVNRFYKRRSSTEWSKKELAALGGVVKRTGVLVECREVMQLYRAGYAYYRRDVVTLLNNWAGEVDKARKQPKIQAQGVFPI